MIKNNIKALIIHVIFSYISFIIFINFNLDVTKLVSEKAARNREIFMNSMAFGTLIVFIILYIVCGFLFMEYGSPIENMFSGIFVTIFGAIIWIITFSTFVNINEFVPADTWFLYNVYNGYSLFFVEQLIVDKPIVLITFSFFPDLLLWLGIELRHFIKEIAKKIQQ